jgi:hypothetical protein
MFQLLGLLDGQDKVPGSRPQKKDNRCDHQITPTAMLAVFHAK